MLQRMGGYARTGRKNRSFYRKSFTWFLFAASVPGLIIALATYGFAVGPMQKNISDLHQNQIKERAQNIDDQFGSVEQDISHWAFNPRFGSDLKEMNFVYQFRDTYDITKTLFMLQGSHPLINQVQLYINGHNTVLFQPEFYMLDDSAQIDGFQRIIAEGTNIYWTDWLPAAEGNAQNADTPIVLVHKIPGDSSSPFGVLVTELKREKVMNLLKTMTPYNQGFTMLLDKKGELLVADHAEETAVNERLRAEVLGREEPSGTFLFNRDDITYSVSYGKLTRLSTEWTYISATPITTITSSVVKLSNTIFLVSASGLVLALLLSWLASRRVYLPVERLLNSLKWHKGEDLARGMDEFQFLENQWNQLHDESLNLRNRLDEQRTHVRSGFLLQLLQGHLASYTEKDLKSRMKLYGWDTDDHQFRILHIQLTGYDILTERFSQGDESLVTFTASNIIEELAAGHFEQFSVMNFHDLTVAVLVMYPDGEPIGERIQSLGTEITKAINGIIHMQVTITFSGAMERIQLIPDMYMEVERATGYRKFVNQNQLIDMEQLTAHADGSEFHYPFALERDIVHAMRASDKEEAERLITLFLEEVLSARGTEILVQQSMLQLFATIQHAILQSGLSPHQLFGGENMFGQLSQIREPEKMLGWMKRKVILPFIDERDARANIELKRLVESTIDYVHAHYASDLSLEQCADLAGTNSYTLSKYFKQFMGINFIDYVTELRIDKAKTLLRETDLKINDIASEVGYQQRYFNRIFKKQVGLTPGQFREQTEG
ncbi:AraC family transcriptional regulator [Paenibacillus sp. PAMC21692]|uniref:AraC family transcriptional regulator n=1 Tax=Paenibacillus sp. PAMC21692 TaxID=2762320 RepID=UPI00164D3AEF|nr:AraC family transcriptional regulator [Paenibacillus sp. PAMC21692]QNK57844.1 AraC family transcriptional regulator [Paenibacillus sp. PAMC21692]